MKMATLCVYLLLITYLIDLASSRNSLPSLEVLAAWNQLDFQFPEYVSRQKLLQRNEFIPENNIITGIKVYRNRAYLTVPRWQVGVPSTLNYVDLNNRKAHSENPLTTPLVPFPSWEMQEIGNCSSLQYIQSMEIDQWGRMWIVDVGRVNIFNASAVRNYCPAKLIIMNLNTNDILQEYEFPAEVVSNTSNFLNDIVVACSDDVDRSRCWAYITDASDAKLVVYSFRENRSWFVRHNSMQANPNATNFPIFGVNYSFNVTIDGIAISPKDQNFDRVYYSPLSSYGLYSIPTSVLRSAQNGEVIKDSDVTIYHPPRASQSDGLAMDAGGLLYYGNLQNSSIVYVNTKSDNFLDEVVLAQDDVHLQWPDTFAFDEKGYLYAVSNRIHRHFSQTLDRTVANFRVVRVFIGSRSYMFSGRNLEDRHGYHIRRPQYQAQNLNNRL